MGHVTVTWSPVDWAAGYLVHRASTKDGPFEPIDQHGGDVLAVPQSPYLDPTAGAIDTPCYAVSSLPNIEADDLPLSPPVWGQRGPRRRPGRDPAWMLPPTTGRSPGRGAR